VSEQPSGPSKRQVVLGTLGSAGLAAAILVVAVLPAEYGIDPLGLGAKLGLTALAGTRDDGAAASPAAARVRADVNGPQTQPYRTDRFEVELRPFEGVEYKYRMDKSWSLVYAWTASEQVKFEFHGEPEGAPAKYFDSYEKSANTHAQGGFVAPTTGIHGWYWKNLGAGKVTIRLTTAGFYDAAIEFRDGNRIVHELKPVMSGGQK